jgi:hypothetical protein
MCQNFQFATSAGPAYDRKSQKSGVRKGYPKWLTQSTDTADDSAVPSAGSLLETIDADEAMLELIQFRGDGLLELLTSTGDSLIQVFSDGNLFFDFGGVHPIARRSNPLIVRAPAGSSLQIAYRQAGQVWTKSWTTA